MAQYQNNDPRFPHDCPGEGCAICTWLARGRRGQLEAASRRAQLKAAADSQELSAGQRRVAREALQRLGKG